MDVVFSLQTSTLIESRAKNRKKEPLLRDTSMKKSLQLLFDITRLKETFMEQVKNKREGSSTHTSFIKNASGIVLEVSF